MSKVYDDSRYGIEKILTFPSTSMVITNSERSITLTEDILPTELGIWVTTAFTLTGAVAGVLTLYKSGAALTQVGALTVYSGAAVYVNPKTTTFTSTGLASGDILVIRTTTSDSTGIGTPYLKYRAKA